MKNPVNYRDDLKKVKGLKTVRGEDVEQDKDELRIVPDPNYGTPYFDDDSQQYEIDNSERSYVAAHQKHYLDHRRHTGPSPPDGLEVDIPVDGYTPFTLGFRVTRTKRWK